MTMSLWSRFICQLPTGVQQSLQGIHYLDNKCFNTSSLITKISNSAIHWPIYIMEMQQLAGRWCLKDLDYTHIAITEPLRDNLNRPPSNTVQPQSSIRGCLITCSTNTELRLQIAITAQQRLVLALHLHLDIL